MLIWLQLGSYQPNKRGCTPPLPEIKNADAVRSKRDYSAKLSATKAEVECERWKNYVFSPPSAMLANEIYTGKDVFFIVDLITMLVRFNLHNT